MSLPFPPQFPRRCGCGRLHTEASWAQLSEQGPIIDEWEALSMKTCPCGSTLGVVVKRFKQDEEEEVAA